MMISTSIRSSTDDGCRITPAAPPGRKRNYWGGTGSQLKRQTKPNGEQQIYVDPNYSGLAKKPLGLDPFRVRNGTLSIVASRTPPDLKAAAVRQSLHRRAS